METEMEMEMQAQTQRSAVVARNTLEVPVHFEFCYRSV